MSVDESPCGCEACDRFSLEPATYCVECVHKGCNRSKTPNCSGVETDNSYCDECTQKKETTFFAGGFYCDSCLNTTYGSMSDIEDRTCPYCGETVLQEPFVLGDGTLIEEDDNLTLRRLYEIDDIYHTDCKIEKETINRRKEENSQLDDF